MGRNCGRAGGCPAVPGGEKVNRKTPQGGGGCARSGRWLPPRTHHHHHIIIIVIIVIIVIFIIITIVIIIVIIITGQPSSWQCGANCPRLRVPCRLLPGYGPPARGRQGH